MLLRRRPQNLLLTLLMPVVLAAVLGTLVYFSVTSLPYLAVSPTTDSTFGRLNGCLLEAVPRERAGFAVSADTRQAATWGPQTLVRCIDGTPPTHEAWTLAATLATFDGEGRLWVAARVDGGPSQLLLIDGGVSPMGALEAQQLIGVAGGAVVLEPSGRLVSTRADGEVTGYADLPRLKEATLSASADGQRVAVVSGGGFYVFEASTLHRLSAEAPCDVEFLWWLREGHRAIVSCGPKASWALIVDVDTGAQETANSRARTRSVLSGPAGPYVERCDGLPCSAVGPVE